MTTFVLMAGTGSDDDYVRRAFGSAIAAVGDTLVAVPPTEDLVAGYFRALDTAAAQGPIVVGGVSIGAVVGLRWALANGGTNCAGVLAALPPWSGAPGESLAALSARTTADAIDTDGLEPTIAAMAAGSPAWLAAELTRSWRSLSSRGLTSQLRVAADYRAPTLDDISELAVPLAIVAATGDLLHPDSVADDWARAAPRSALVKLPIDQWGPREYLLGHAALEAWDSLSERT